MQVGAGRMGAQIGCEFALGGHTVTFLVRDAVGARARIERALATAAEAGLVPAAAPAYEIVTEREAIAGRVDLVLESVPELLEVKREVLAPIAAAFPEAIIGSNTSSIPLTELGEAVGAPERTLGVHYWNPPLLMPPVELVAGARTDPALVERVRQAVAALGKEPILVERDVPGFIWNRLQAALLREVLWLVEAGVASPRTIDQAIRSGLARRYRYTGPFDTIALGGVHSWEQVAANLFPVLSNASAIAQPLERWLDQSDDELEAARARRDAGLAAELRDATRRS